jgi:hypothetical protein
MSKFLFILILFNFSQAFSQSEEEVQYRFLRYGLSNFYYEKSVELIGEKYNIESYRVAGCMITEKLLDSVSIENEKMWRMMDSLHGDGFEDRFHKDVIAQYKLIQESEDILESSPDFKKLYRRTKRKFGNPGQFLDSVATERNTYYWHVGTYNLDNYKFVQRFRAVVNLEKRTCEIVE